MSEAGCFFAEAARLLKDGAPLEIVALELKSGADALGEITGQVTNEDVLDSIFSQFCLGK
jgi:tRNA modification GTPase